MKNYNEVTFESLINDILLLDNILLSVSSQNAIAEAKLEKNTPFRIRGQWATIGDETGEWHIHVNIQETREAKFIIESRDNGKKSYSIRFFNSKNMLVLRVNFIKIYTQDNQIINESLARYENLYSKYGNKESLSLATN